MKGSMNHHSAGAGDEDPDGAFGDTILPLCPNTTETDGLGVVDDFIDKALTLEDTIVGVVRFD
jgi:hypothetical protein